METAGSNGHPRPENREEMVRFAGPYPTNHTRPLTVAMSPLHSFPWEKAHHPIHSVQWLACHISRSPRLVFHPEFHHSVLRNMTSVAKKKKKKEGTFHLNQTACSVLLRVFWKLKDRKYHSGWVSTEVEIYMYVYMWNYRRKAEPGPPGWEDPQSCASSVVLCGD